jgi:hypothetical protein
MGRERAKPAPRREPIELVATGIPSDCSAGVSDHLATTTGRTHVNVEPTQSVRQPRRTRRSIHSIVIAVVATIPIAACSSADSDEQTTASTVERTTVAPTTVAPTTVTPTTVTPTTVAPATEIVSFQVESANNIPVTFTAPVSWTVVDGWMVYTGAGGVMVEAISNIYADGCQWVLLDPPVGPTVDDLVAAWANLPDFVATAAVDVTVDGYAGKQIEFTVPDYIRNECKKKVPFGGVFALYDIPGLPVEDAPATWAQGPNQHLQSWILDVDGTRLVISAFSFPYTSPKDRAALEEILASIQIG